MIGGCVSTRSVPAPVNPEQCFISRPVLKDPYLKDPNYCMKIQSTNSTVIDNYRIFNSNVINPRTFVSSGLLFPQQVAICCNYSDSNVYQGYVTVSIPYQSVNISGTCNFYGGILNPNGQSIFCVSGYNGAYLVAPNSTNSNYFEEYYNGCFRPDFVACWNKSEDTIIPISITIKFEDPQPSCYSTKFNDLIKKYTREVFKVKGAMGNYGPGRRFGFRIGSDITNIDFLYISDPDGATNYYLEMASDCNAARDGISSKRDPNNPCYMFQKYNSVEDVLYFQISKSQNSRARSFIWNQNENIGWTLPEVQFLLKESNNELYFMLISYYTNYRGVSGDRFYTSSSEWTRVLQTSDLYKQVKMYTSSSTANNPIYDLMNLYA